MRWISEAGDRSVGNIAHFTGAAPASSGACVSTMWLPLSRRPHPDSLTLGKLGIIISKEKGRRRRKAGNRESKISKKIREKCVQSPKKRIILWNGWWMDLYSDWLATSRATRAADGILSTAPCQHWASLWTPPLPCCPRRSRC